MNLEQLITSDWKEILSNEFSKQYFIELDSFVQQERSDHVIFPPREATFTALDSTPHQKTRVIILGQDPYHGINQAHGLSFSVKDNKKLPPSLKNILKELHSDLDQELRTNGDLGDWAEQGVLLLNTVLTVREGNANSHKGKGWELFTDTILQKLNEKLEPIVFVLWGNQARKKKVLLNRDRHLILESAHPSPLSARHGFIGSKCFSKINEFLVNNGTKEIKWS